MWCRSAVSGPMKAVILLATVLLTLPQFAEAGPNGRVRVSDGDSLVVGGHRVRLFGIDAHELDQTCTNEEGREIACGDWARHWARNMFQGRYAQCDTMKFDRYERALATCEIDGEDVGEILLRAGVVAIYPRETLQDYIEYEKEAQLLARGIWAWDSESPLDHRAAQRQERAAAQEIEVDGCSIKGNISGSGKIYHMPGQENYAQTSINTGKGERWFCSEAEALDAGWRKARR